MIIHDRGCKLHTLALRREPYFFRNTIFRVDAMHYANHVGCSEGYNSKLYSKLGSYSSEANVPRANTQVCEQGNALLKHIRVSCCFMTQHSFMVYTRMYLANKNMNKDRVKK